MKKVDRRILRTRQGFRDAMLALLREKSYTALTIQDLAERAQLNRATFYHHYKDKEELLVDALGSLFDHLLEDVIQDARTPIFEDASPSLFAFRHVQEYKELYEVLLAPEGPGFVMQKMIDYIAGFALRKLQLWAPQEFRNDGHLQLMAQHVAGSLFALVRWWFQQGMQLPAEQMAVYAHGLANKGILAMLSELQTQEGRIDGLGEVAAAEVMSEEARNAG